MRERRREDRDEDAGRAGHCGVRLASGHPRLPVPATKPRDCLPIHRRYRERQFFIHTRALRRCRSQPLSGTAQFRSDSARLSLLRTAADVRLRLPKDRPPRSLLNIVLHNFSIGPSFALASRR